MHQVLQLALHVSERTPIQMTITPRKLLGLCMYVIMITSGLIVWQFRDEYLMTNWSWTLSYIALMLVYTCSGIIGTLLLLIK